MRKEWYDIQSRFLNDINKFCDIQLRLKIF